MNHFTKSDNGTYRYLVIDERLFILVESGSKSQDKYYLMEKVRMGHAFTDGADAYTEYFGFPTIQSAEEYIRAELEVHEEQPVYETWSVHIK